MKSFLERDPGPIGVIGTAVLIAALVAAFNTDKIPFVGGSTYHAYFSDASALRAGDEVQVAGVPVGKVTDIELADDAVEVTFTADLGNVELGAGTSAAVKVHTVLGRRYLDLASHGGGRLEAGSTIPVERTASGYDLSNALGDTAATVEATNLDSMTETFDTAAGVMDEISPELERTLEGLTGLARTVGSRDEEVRSLLTHVRSLGDVLNVRSDQIRTMITDGNTLLAALDQRSATIRSLLVTVRAMSEQLRAVAGEHVDTLGPLLDKLGNVSEILDRNRENIDQILTSAPDYARQLPEAVSSGPYFGVILQNVVPADLDATGHSYGGDN
ncbi:MCE family protein [Rhodococcus sp. NPDC060086]|uniref:MCE family protein n=1 Tax=Rhodococcus sp. NPDC060086 TaxID=3347055 RepID=UPI00365F7AF2